MIGYMLVAVISASIGFLLESFIKNLARRLPP